VWRSSKSLRTTGRPPSGKLSGHHRRDVRNAGALQSDYYVFHFAGRPLASLEKIVNGGVPSSALLHLTTARNSRC
jgi:hypothetical protein